MKYRTKLYIALAGTSIIALTVALAIAYLQVKSDMRDEIEDTVQSIAATAAVSINADILKTIKTKEDQYSPAYVALQKQMRKIRNINRRGTVFVKFLYTIVPFKEDPNRFYYQVDSEENTPDFSHFGEEVPDARQDQIGKRLNEIFSPPIYTNKWGTFLTGFAPIYDSSGKYVATLAADLNAADINEKLFNLIYASLISFVASLLLALLVSFFLAKQQTRSLKKFYKGVDEIGKGNLNYKINVQTKDEFGDLANAINDMTEGLKQRERLKLNFTRYVSKDIMEMIIKNDSPVILKGERRKVTLLFSDIRQFTQLAEHLNPEIVVSLLNEYFGIMVEIAFANNGSLDKFIGDGMMVEFGVPIDDPRQEYHAVKTAIEMYHAAHQLSEKWQKEGKPKIEIGIGIHTGEAIVGNIGSERRIEYTAIGDTVNVASRLEQLTKEFKVPIVISEATINPIQKDFKFKSLGPVTLRGRTHPITVYQLELD